MTTPRSWRLVFAALTLALPVLASSPTAASTAEFARCIANSGAIFYGAHWCPYCAKQMAAFGSSARHLPYVECYRPGSREKLSRCDGVKAFPAWQLEDGTIHTGLKSFEKLARLTGCKP